MNLIGKNIYPISSIFQGNLGEAPGDKCLLWHLLMLHSSWNNFLYKWVSPQINLPYEKQLTMSTTVDILNENRTSPSYKKQNRISFLSKFSSLIGKQCEQHMEKVIHGVKVGIALVLVSLLYLIDPLFEQVGENAMWAIMTVVVVFEFFAGATLSKGLLRGIGTILGGGLGCLAANLADDLGKIGNAVIVGTSVFIFGAMATYCRLIPSIKKRYDYGVMIFILTFNLVAVSGLRAEKVMELALERLSTIGMGFAVCVFTSLLIFPMWASDELHRLTSSKFDKLACCIEECMKSYFSVVGEKDITRNSSCKLVLHSKSSDESLANFARWEPWHGRFGFYYPWEKYIQIGELIRELASIILSMQGCLDSPLQPSTPLQQAIQKTCKDAGFSLGLTMRELGESIMNMKRCEAKVLTARKLQSIKLEIGLVSTSSKLGATENVEVLAVANFLFLLMEIVDKVEILAEEVEALGEIAGFQSK